MSLEQARELARLVTQGRDDFVARAELDLERFYAAAALIVAADHPPAEARRRLDEPATALLLALAGAWVLALSGVQTAAHRLFGLPPPDPFPDVEARDLMTPGVLGLTNAALLTMRTSPLPTLALQAWGRQYERGGAFTGLRARLRGSTAGTFNLLTNAALVDTLRARDGPEVILGAYNPLDERTEPLDRALVLNTGQPIVTARGRTVRSIPGLTGKYTLTNAWIPGSPRLGGDTHDGCRCVLIPEERP